MYNLRKCLMQIFKHVEMLLLQFDMVIRALVVFFAPIFSSFG